MDAYDTRTYIGERLTTARKTTKDWHKQIERWRALYDFNHYQHNAKPQEQQYSDPTYTNAVDLAVGIIISNPISFSARAWAPDIMREELVSHVEKYLAGTLEINSQRNEYDIQYETAMHFVRDGCAVLYSPWDPITAEMVQTYAVSDDGGTPKLVFTETPILTQVIDPLKIFVAPGSSRGRWGYIIREEEMSVAEIERQYGVIPERYSRSHYTQKEEIRGKLMDFWEVVEAELPKTDQFGEPIFNSVLGKDEVDRVKVVRNAVLFNEEVLRPLTIMEGYQDIPYDIQFYKPVSREKSKDWGHGIIKPLETSVEALEKTINRRGRQLDVFSSLPLVFKTMAGRNLQIDPGLGNYVEMSPDEDMGFPSWPGNPPDVERQIEFLRSRVQQSGFTDSMYGSGASSQLSGYAMSQLGDQNRIRLEQPIRHLKMLWNSWARKVLALTEYFGGGAVIRVYGQLRGEDFVGQIVPEGFSQFLIQVKLKPEYPNDGPRKHAMATQAKGTLSDTTIMEKYLDIEQPDEEMARKVQEMIVQHPAAINLIILRQLDKWAASGDEAAAAIAEGMKQSLMQQGLPLNGAGGPGGRSPEQMSGMPSATGQLSRSEQGRQPPGQEVGDVIAQLTGAAPNMQGGIGGF